MFLLRLMPTGKTSITGCNLNIPRSLASTLIPNPYLHANPPDFSMPFRIIPLFIGIPIHVSVSILSHSLSLGDSRLTTRPSLPKSQTAFEDQIGFACVWLSLLWSLLLS